MGSSTFLGSSTHSRKSVWHISSPGMAILAQPLKYKTPINVIKIFLVKFYPPAICPIPIGISITVIVPSGSTIVSLITSKPSAFVITS